MIIEYPEFLPDISDRIDRSSPQARGLVGLWPLNDGFGTIGRDLAGNIPATGVGNWGTAYNGKCARGTGSAAIGTLAANTLLTPPFSVSCRFLVTATGTNQELIGSNGTADTFHFRVSGQQVQTFKPGVIGASTASFVVAGVWYHVAATVAGTTTKVYVNGLFSTSDPNNLSFAGTSTIRYFGLRASGTESLTGLLSDVRFYSRDLSAFEIKYICDRPGDVYQKRRIIISVPAQTTLFPCYYGGSRLSGVAIGGAAISGIAIGGSRIW